MAKKKINVEYCPHCKDTEMVQVGDQIEVFICENCKFKIKKKNGKKK